MRSVFASLLLFLPFSALAQSEADVDRLVNAQVAKTGSPAYSIAIVKDGKITLAKGYGYANLETGTPATAETVYRIGSVTKQFSATLVMQLVNEGKVKLDDPVTKHLPELPKAFEGVTVRQILNHTSGIKSYTSIPSFGKRLREDATTMDMVNMAATEKPDFKPGEQWAYNNTGYILVGMLVEKLSAKPYATVLQDRITSPLKMEQTRVSRHEEIVKNRASGYATERGKLSNAQYMSLTWPYAAGAIESTVVDLAKWDAALYGEAVLPQAVLKQMWEPAKLAGGKTFGYGFGWSIANEKGVQLIDHGGDIPGFNSYIGRVPGKKTTVIVLSNVEGGRSEDLGRKILGLTIPELAPAERKVIEDKDPAATKFARGVLESALRGDLNMDLLTPEFQKILTPERLKDASAGLGSLGTLQRFDLVEAKEENGMRIRTYLIKLGTTELTAVFALTKDNKVAGLQIRA